MYDQYIPEEVRTAFEESYNSDGIVKAKLKDKKNSTFYFFPPGKRSLLVNRNDLKNGNGYDYDMTDEEALKSKNYFNTVAMWYYLSWRCNEEQISQPFAPHFLMNTNRPLAELVNITEFEDGLSLLGTLTDILQPMAKSNVQPFAYSDDGKVIIEYDGKDSYILDP